MGETLAYKMKIIDEKNESRKKLNKLTKTKNNLTRATSSFTGFVMGVVIFSFLLSTRITGMIISIDAILIALDIGFVTIISGWATSRWDDIFASFVEDNFFEIRRKLEHLQDSLSADVKKE